MMNKLALSALCLGALFQSNCIIAEGEGVFDVSWQLTTACPAGAAVEIHAQDTVTKKIFTDIYSCTDGAGLMSRLPLADYDVWIDVTTGDGLGLLAQSTLLPASLDFDGDTVRVDLPTFSVEEGFFGFTWSLADAVGATTCEDVFADTVAMEATVVTGNTATRVGLFTCADGTATSDPIAVGEYEMYLDILQGQDLLGSSLKRTEKIEWGNQLKDLGNFEFSFQ